MANVQSSLGPSSWMTNQPVNSGARKTNLEILGPIKSPTQPANPPTQTSTYRSPFMGQNSQTVQSPSTSNTFAPSFVGQSNPNTYNNTTQNLGAQGQGNSTSNTASSGLLGIAQNGSPQLQQANQNVQGLMKEQTEIANNPNLASEVASGRGQAISGLINSAQTGVQNALAGQGQQISAGSAAGGLGIQGQQNQISAQGTAGNLTQPVANAGFFGSPQTGNVVGTGSTANGGTGNQLIDNAVQNAVSMIKSGGSTTDAMATLSSLGAPAQQAMINAMRKFDPNWNATASNAIAQQNMTQGQQYQGQATQLNTTLQQLDKLTPTITDFIQKSGLNNQDNPFYNKAIKDYSSQLRDPAGVASLNAMMADVKTYTAQILGSSGLNPTEVSATVNSFDPSNLSSGQLTSFLSNLKNLGQTRLQPLQQTASQSYGSGNPSMGAQANPSTSSSYAPNADTAGDLNTANPIIQGLVGGGMEAAGGIGGLFNHITGLAGMILK